MHKRTTRLGSAFLGLLAVLVLVLLQTGSAGPGSTSRTNVDMSLLKISPEAVTIEFYPPQGQTGTLEAQLHDLGGKLLAKVTRPHDGRPLLVDLFAQIDQNDLANYYLQYRFDSGQSFRRRSLLFVGHLKPCLCLAVLICFCTELGNYLVLVYQFDADLCSVDRDTSSPVAHQHPYYRLAAGHKFTLAQYDSLENLTDKQQAAPPEGLARIKPVLQVIVSQIVLVDLRK